MPLAACTKLGPYEIQSSLGAGGMGEVYRATDSKLRRDVALKMRGLLRLRPDFGAIVQQELSKWWLPEMIEQMIGDLRKAGLEIAGE